MASESIGILPSDTHHRDILDSLPEWVWEVDKNGFIVYSNLAVENLLGFERFSLTGKSILTLAPPGKPEPALKLLDCQWDLNNPLQRSIHSFRDTNGKDVLLSTTGAPFYNTQKKTVGIRFISRPVRKADNDDTGDYAKFVLDNIHEAAAIMDEDQNILYINPGFTQLFGYTHEEIIGKPLATLGTDRKISTLQPSDVTRTLDDQLSWQGEVHRRHKSGEYIPCLLNAQGVSKGGVNHYIGTYFDLRKIKRNDKIAKEALKKTIHVLCEAIEVRNVLKGQHQDGVTDLAVAIAFEMGMDYEFIEGLTLAAAMHDLGEMYLPAEVASKDSALDDVERALIHTHPGKCFDLLKHIRYPWPVAEIILQHHERFDGSGYPKGVKGDDILMEARILAVADVVATMLSDRPYRPACNFEQVIKELEDNKGSSYDPLVVDMCLRLMREKNYRVKRPQPL